MLKVIDPYPISDPVAQIALQALSKNGLDILKDRINELNERKHRFIDAVSKLSIVDEIFSDKANYILLRFKDDSSKVFDKFVRRGVILRDFSTKPLLKNSIRITIGSEEEMKEVLNILEELNKA